MVFRASSAFVYVSILVLLACAAAKGSEYQVTNLGNFEPVALNDYGQVAGNILIDSSGTTHACLWSNGVVTDLGTLGTDSFAQDINNSGEVVGDSGLPGDGTITHAFIYAGGKMSDLDTWGSISSSASGINNLGQIVGFSSLLPGAPNRPILFENGTMTVISGLDGISRVIAKINDQGQIVGNYASPSGNSHAFIYGNGTLTDLGTLGGSFSLAEAVNNRGQAVGYSLDQNGNTHAFIYSGGTMTDINGQNNGTSNAYGINDAGQVVGNNDTVGPFLYANGTLSSLNSLLDNPPGFVQLNSAIDINSSGQILAGGTLNGLGQSFLLTPVPEPSSLVLLGIGACGVSWLLRRRRIA